MVRGSHGAYRRGKRELFAAAFLSDWILRADALLEKRPENLIGIQLRDADECKEAFCVEELMAVTIPNEVVDSVRQSLGEFFAPITKSSPEMNVQDFLDTAKSATRARILERYTPLRNKRVLEVGSGFGTNLAVWMKQFEVDGYGVEPESAGFYGGYEGSRKILAANGVDPERVLNAVGESLPFPDESFDIVYSANVLEHTASPERVLEESVRVLKPGGILHMEMPNFLSYFEGHYLVLQPPLVSTKILPWLIQRVYRRDPAFARTLNTRINPIWCKKNIRALQSRYALELVSTGEELFLDRLRKQFQFEMEQVADKLGSLLALMQLLNGGNLLGRLIVALRGHYPIYLTARRVR